MYGYILKTCIRFGMRSIRTYLTIGWNLIFTPSTYFAFLSLGFMERDEEAGGGRRGWKWMRCWWWRRKEDAKNGSRRRSKIFGGWSTQSLCKHFVKGGEGRKSFIGRVFLLPNLYFSSRRFLPWRHEENENEQTPSVNTDYDESSIIQWKPATLLHILLPCIFFILTQLHINIKIILPIERWH